MKGYPTSFAELIGNERIKRQLAHMVSKKTGGHVLLFSGMEGIGKSRFAWALVAQLMKEYGDRPEDHFPKIAAGKHPDIHVYHPEGKLGLHAIQPLREMNEQIYFPPYEASWKVFIIHEAERMLKDSANSLLKAFEEPPARTLIILLSSSSAALLPTLTSRCQALYFKPIDSILIEKFLCENYSLQHALCKKIALQAQGSLGRAVRLAQRGGEDTMRVAVLRRLSKPPSVNYRLLQEEIQAIHEQMERLRKKEEEAAREELMGGISEGISAQQQHALEREIEGRAALVFIQEARVLFEVILSWYRDLDLLLLGGDPAYLINQDFQGQLEQSVQRGDFKPLSEVYQAIKEADLALQRSTPFPLCLENLFLKLDRLY